MVRQFGCRFVCVKFASETFQQMTSTSTTRITWLNNKSKLTEEIRIGNVEWCFQPMLICLRIFGIDFKWSQQRPSFTQNLIHLICLCWFITIALTMYGHGLDIYDNMSKPPKNKYHQVSYKIKWSCLMVEIVGTYATLVFSTWKRGQQLVQYFNQIEIHSEIDKKTYHQLRRTIIILIFLLILTVRLKFKYASFISKYYFQIKVIITYFNFA